MQSDVNVCLSVRSRCPLLIPDGRASAPTRLNLIVSGPAAKASSGFLRRPLCLVKEESVSFPLFTSLPLAPSPLPPPPSLHPGLPSSTRPCTRRQHLSLPPHSQMTTQKHQLADCNTRPPSSPSSPRGVWHRRPSHRQMEPTLTPLLPAGTPEESTAD